MSGKTLIIGFVVFVTIFTGALYYTLVYGYYNEVFGLESIEVDGRDVAVFDYVGLDATSSPLKLRGCFTVDPADFENVTVHDAPTPLMTPKWFDCFDALTLSSDLENGLAVAYVAKVEDRDGIDRLVMVYPDGRAYQWRQVNDKYQE